MGRLYESNLLTAPQAYFCPEQQDERFRFNTPPNPWPPPGAVDSNIRAGYCARPSVRWDFTGPLEPMKRLAKMKSKALLSDVVGVPGVAASFNSVHARGINVLYGDRSVTLVPFAQYKASTDVINASTPPRPISMWLEEDDLDSPALWNRLDLR
jgi:hypothetical protein